MIYVEEITWPNFFLMPDCTTLEFHKYFKLRFINIDGFKITDLFQPTAK